MDYSENILMKHEEEAAMIIARQPRVLLFDDMGVGKTVTVLNGLKMASGGRTGPLKCVVCVPNTLINQWAGEAGKWLLWDCVIGACPVDQRSVKYEYFIESKSNTILITNYQLLSRDEFFKNFKGWCLVLDEGYLLRNKFTKTYSAVKNIRNNYDKVVMLSGNYSSMSDVHFYNLADLMFPGWFKPASKNEIQSMLGECFISRGLDVVENNVPENKPEIKFIEQPLSDLQKRLLAEIVVEENRAMKNPDSYSAKKFYRKRMDVLHSPRIIDGSYSHAPKEKFLIDFLNCNENNVVIYCPDKRFFKLIKSLLNENNVKFSIVTGGQSSKIRDRNLSLFYNDSSVTCLLISGVGRFGLNLQVANVLICMGMPNSVFDLGQMVGRLYRIKQNKCVVCYIPYHTDSVEEIFVGNVRELYR